MFESIFETVVMGSNTVFLDIPENEYFLSYDDLDRASVEELVKNYFLMKGRDGIPIVKDLEYDINTHRVKITVDVQQQRDYKLESYEVPDSLNIQRSLR